MPTRMFSLLIDKFFHSCYTFHLDLIIFKFWSQPNGIN